MGPAFSGGAQVAALDRAYGGGRAEGAIQANGEQGGVAHGDPKSFGGLSTEGASGGVRDGAADHDGQPLSGLVKRFFSREEGRLGVERIEHRFDEKGIDTAVNQGDHLAGVRGDEVLEGDGAVAGVVDIRADAGCSVRGAHRPRDEAWLVWGLGGPSVRGFPRYSGRRRS